MSLMIGIISYLPKDEKVRSKRVKAHAQQLEWLHSLYPDIVPNIVAQGYQNEYHDNVSYVERFETGIGASAARNIILKLFYASDYDYLLMCDDDTIAYPYYNYEEFMQRIAEEPEVFKSVDAVMAVEPEYHAFKARVLEDKGNLSHYKFTPKELNSGAATCFLKNIKKYYNEEIYFDEQLEASTGNGREDIDFLLQWLLKGFNFYQMETWIRKSLSFDYSAIFGSDTKARDAILMKCLDFMCQRYSKYGLARNLKGQITWKNFNNRYNRTLPVLYIPRKNPITISDKLMPKQKSVDDGRKRLF